MDARKPKSLFEEDTLPGAAFVFQYMCDNIIYSGEHKDRLTLK